MMSSDLETTREWELRDYLELIFRRKFLILVVFVVCVLAVSLYQLTRPDVYGSSTTFGIELDTGAGLDGYASMPYYYYLLDQSRSVEYYNTIVFSDLFYEQIQQAIDQDSLLVALGEEALEEARQAAMRNLSLSLNDETKLLTLSLRAGSALVAYRTADLVAQVFRRRNQEIELESAQNMVRFIDQQRHEAQDRLEEVERALLEFKGRGTLSPISFERGVVNRVVQAEATLEQIELERKLAET
ncbi:hypothetical protein JW992_14350, partial [candidate division KSB1 bacterium]|nr:hypothetical protein [candidate division KSB1 bacterium]